jgi:hypothetical protein
MSGASKITLSAEELQLADNTEWILTKRTIIDTAVLLFAQLAEQFKIHAEQQSHPLAETIIHSSPKISKGENYRMLPWVILDYPRSFQKDQVFAIRTMFWWGNFISISLHVSGNYARSLQRVLQNEMALKSLNDYYLCVNTAEWEHHFEPGNYRPIQTLTAAEVKNITYSKQFIKLAIKFELQQWNEMPELLEKEFLKLLQLAVY